MDTDETHRVAGGDPLPLEWAGDRLLVTDQAALARIRRPALSASTMNAVNACPARWAAEKLAPAGTPDPMSASSLGTDIHAILFGARQDAFAGESGGPFTGLYGLRPGLRTEAALHRLVLDYGRRMWHPGQEVERQTWAHQVLTKALNVFRLENPQEVEVVALEHGFDLTLSNGVPLRGSIDRVVSNAAGRIVIDDGKSGRVTTRADVARFGHDHEGDQMRLYVDAWASATGRRPAGARLLYLAAPLKRAVDIRLGEVASTLESADRAWDTLNGSVSAGSFDTKGHALCGFCPLVASCPSAARGRDERSDYPLDPARIGFPAPRPLLTGVAAHGGASTENEAPWVRGARDYTEEDGMSVAGFTRGEGKAPYSPQTGGLDPISYEAQGLFGLWSLAAATLRKAGQPVRPTHVRALAATFLVVVEKAQMDIFGVEPDGSRASATRLRGVLHEAVEVVPPPFEAAEADAWREWSERVGKVLTAAAEAVVALHSHRFPDTPWEVFVPLRQDPPAVPADTYDDYQAAA